MATESHQEYQDRADECDRLAKMAANTEVRETLLYLAKRWSDFAADAESKLMPSYTSTAPLHPSS